jgi:hypothetical protein
MKKESEQKFNERVLDRLVKRLEDKIENGIRCRILVPDWRSFKKTIYQSRHELYERNIEDTKTSKQFLCLYHEVFEFQVQQTRFFNHYEEGGMVVGFGFNNFECLHCGEKDLLYDSVQEEFYCALCG